MADRRRRRGQRARPMWLEIGGQQRLRRLHSGLQLRRRQLQDWSTRMDEFDDRIADRLQAPDDEPRRARPFRGAGAGEGTGWAARRQRASDYGTDNEDVGTAGRNERTEPARSPDGRGSRHESAGRSGPSPRPPRRPDGRYDGGYDIGAADVTGTRRLMQRRGSDQTDDSDQRRPAPTRRTTAKRTTAKKAPAKKTAAAKRTTAKKAPAKTAAAKKATAKKTTTRRTTATARSAARRRSGR